MKKQTNDKLNKIFRALRLSKVSPLLHGSCEQVDNYTTKLMMNYIIN